MEAIKQRRSVRRFKSDPVKEEDLRKILDAARWAPSAGNMQPLELVVVKDEEAKQRLARASPDHSFIAEASVVIVVCANVPRTTRRYGHRGARLYVVQDTAAAAQNIHLAAYSLGYNTCWVGAFDDEEVARVIRVPDSVRPMTIIPLGRPAEEPHPPSRLPLDEIVHENHF
ncbi:MAG: nitroreductase family protein [Candidatus Hadarchaeota archaeon]|nr:nitroreductase family protein [Candidatus Hadarchaeota archaeon]